MAVSPPSEPKTRVRIDRHQTDISICKEPLGNDVEMRLVKVEGGEFLMGSPKDELDRQGTEDPQHLVQVPTFWMGQYPVTQTEWRIVAGLPQGARAKFRPVKIQGRAVACRERQLV